MPPVPAPVINAVRFVLVVDGDQVTYSELIGISSEIDASGLTSSSGPLKQLGTTLPPKVALKRGVDGGGQIWDWHQLARAGDPAARKTCQLLLQDPGGKTLLTYVLEGTWPTRLDIAGPAPGGPPQPVSETVELTCDTILLQPG